MLTPDGRLARYLFGIEYGPRDLRLAIVEASTGKVGSPVDALLLYCYHYDPMTGRYGLVIMRAMRIAGAATVLALGAFIVVMVRRERRLAYAALAANGPTLAPEPVTRRADADMWSGTPLFPEQRVDDGRSRRRAVFFPARVCDLLLAADRRPDRLSTR